MLADREREIRERVHSGSSQSIFLWRTSEHFINTSNLSWQYLSVISKVTQEIFERVLQQNPACVVLPGSVLQTSFGTVRTSINIPLINTVYHSGTGFHYALLWKTKKKVDSYNKKKSWKEKKSQMLRNFVLLLYGKKLWLSRWLEKVLLCTSGSFQRRMSSANKWL